MTQIPLPHLPPLPEITFRHLDGPEDAFAYVRLVEACREIDAIDPFSTLETIPTVEEMRTSFADCDPQTEEEYQEFIHQSDLDPTLWQVSWDQDQPVGMGISKGYGYIDEVSVGSAYRRQGIAQALILYALAALCERGVQRVRLLTDANNRHGARSLYEKIGFSVTKEFPRYRKSL